MIYYPLALGPQFHEIRRVLVGLQTIDAFGIALPDWRPGDEVIVPMKGDDQEKVPEKGAKCYDWFFLHQAAAERRSGRKPRREV